MVDGGGRVGGSDAHNADGEGRVVDGEGRVVGEGRHRHCACNLVADSPACCSLCLRCMSLTSAGVMRVHGPMGRRCPGSGKPPRGFSGQRTSVPSGEAVQHQGVTPSSQPSVVSLSQGEPAVVQHLPIVRVLRRIPKAAREQCSSKLTSILEEVVRSNDVCSWNRLFQFATSCLRLPHRGNPHQSLASKIKDQLVYAILRYPSVRSLGIPWRGWLVRCRGRLRMETSGVPFAWPVLRIPWRISVTTPSQPYRPSTRSPILTAAFPLCH